MRVPSLLLLVLGLVLLPCTVGCHLDLLLQGTGYACQTDDQCPRDQHCVAGACSRASAGDAGIADGAVGGDATGADLGTVDRWTSDLTTVDGATADGAASDAPRHDAVAADHTPGDAADAAGIDAAPEIFAPGLSEPHHLALDDTHVYWINGGNNQVQRQAKISGSPQLVTSAGHTPRGIAVGGGRLVVADDRGASATDDVFWVASDGSSGSPNFVAQSVNLQVETDRYAPTVAIAGDSVYWLQQMSSSSANLRRYDVVGGTESTAATDYGWPRQLTRFGNSVAIIDTNDRALASVPLLFDGETAAAFYSIADSRTFFLMAAGSDVVFVAFKTAIGTPATIERVTALGTHQVLVAEIPDLTPLQKERVDVVAMVADDLDVYFAVDVPTNLSEFNGRIYRVAPTGSPGVPVLIANALDPSGLALDATHVYWSDQQAGHIKRARR